MERSGPGMLRISMLSGVSVTVIGSGISYAYDPRDREITLLALRHGLPETRAKDPNSKRNVNEWVGGWMKAVTADPPKPEDVSQTFEVIELLLEFRYQ